MIVMDVEAVIAEVLPRIRPTDEERAFVEGLMEELKIIAEETIEGGMGLDAKPYFVGSLAKDTYLAGGDHDADLFLAFPLDVPLEELRETGLKLGRAIAERLDSYEVAYAEHPLRAGELQGGCQR